MTGVLQGPELPGSRAEGKTGIECSSPTEAHDNRSASGQPEHLAGLVQEERDSSAMTLTEDDGGPLEGGALERGRQTPKLGDQGPPAGGAKKTASKRKWTGEGTDTTGSSYAETAAKGLRTTMGIRQGPLQAPVLLGTVGDGDQQAGEPGSEPLRYHDQRLFTDLSFEMWLPKMEKAVAAEATDKMWGADQGQARRAAADLFKGVLVEYTEAALAAPGASKDLGDAVQATVGVKFDDVAAVVDVRRATLRKGDQVIEGRKHKLQLTIRAPVDYLLVLASVISWRRTKAEAEQLAKGAPAAAEVKRTVHMFGPWVPATASGLSIRKLQTFLDMASKNQPVRMIDAVPPKLVYDQQRQRTQVVIHVVILCDTHTMRILPGYLDALDH